MRKLSYPTLNTERISPKIKKLGNITFYRCCKSLQMQFVIGQIKAASETYFLNQSQTSRKSTDVTLLVK